MIEKKLIVSINENKKSTCDVKKSYSKITRNKKDYKVETTLVCGKEKDTITRKFSFKDCKNCNTRTETPLGPNGKPDFESLNAIDVKLFDSQVSKMLKGTKVTVPTFNFIEGKKEYKRTVQLKDNDILIIEGLHALNEELLTNIPRKKKFKVYISPLIYLNIDNDNRIGMTDLRLLRRMVRDNRTRGYNPSKTLESWSDVRDGEEKYVFPYQDNADVMFNTSLAYELAVIKTYAEPLLFTISEDDPNYQLAQRLIELLKFVLPIPSETVPKTSILREFIGGSYFE
jgi:uridine kinase